MASQGCFKPQYLSIFLLGFQFFFLSFLNVTIILDFFLHSIFFTETPFVWKITNIQKWNDYICCQPHPIYTFLTRPSSSWMANYIQTLHIVLQGCLRLYGHRQLPSPHCHHVCESGVPSFFQHALTSYGAVGMVKGLRYLIHKLACKMQPHKIIPFPPRPPWARLY